MSLRPIHHTFAPHVDSRFFLRSLGELLQPWRWQSATANDQLEAALGSHFNAQAWAFFSGREALYALLSTLKLTHGDEVIVQGYTCIVVPNAIIAAGGTPVYADIDEETLNLSKKTVESILTPKTKAIICQHTFGIPAPLKELRALCDAKGIVLIEDCAHIILEKMASESIGSVGDAVILSFGRDKAISGVAGGAAIVRKRALAEGIAQLATKRAPVRTSVIVRLLLYPLLYGTARPLYRFGGKALLAAAGKLSLLLPIVTRREKCGVQSHHLHSIPAPCARLTLAELKRLPQLNAHRRKLTKIYLQTSLEHGWHVLTGIDKTMPLQKFPLFVKDAANVRSHLKQRNIHLDDGWCGCVICPANAEDQCVDYKSGSDPHAENVGMSILSLPTHRNMTFRKAKMLVKELRGVIDN